MESSFFTLTNFRHLLGNFPLSSLVTPLMVLLVLTLLVLPIPPLMLDILFTFNIILALLIIMVAIHTATPMDFSSFPIIILFATVMRLGLNVASTRVVLIEGHEGGDAAGKVIEAFGQFVIGGNYAVGLIVFIILMIINFIVITKGAGRVSEVIARFTLDALPGKQMAIDADLNAGVIDQETARVRRAQVSQESDFFGSMDGASSSSEVTTRGSKQVINTSGTRDRDIHMNCRFRMRLGHMFYLPLEMVSLLKYPPSSCPSLPL